MPGCVRTAARAVCAGLIVLWVARPAQAQTPRSAYEELQTFSGVLNHIRLNYADSVSYAHLVRAAIDGVLRSLDPHSYFLPRGDWTKFGALSRGELGTAGLVLEDINGAPTVISVGPGSTAERAGVLPGDRVLRVADTLTAGLSAKSVELLVAGERGSKVRLALERGPVLEPDTFSVTVKRTDYRWPSVSAVRMADSVTGYVRLREFGPDAADQMHDALKDLERQKAERLILDLRGNPGGLVISAVDVASEFFAKNTLIFRTRGRKRDVDQDYFTRRGGDYDKLPLIVLIDEGSASAAEALAGSLQDHDRALILGRRSFGKALVQSSFFLESGDVVRLTIGRVLTPSGRSIQRPYRGLAVEQYRAQSGQPAAGEDTLPTFMTDNAREVRGGGGIRPDVELPGPPDSPVWWSVAADRGLDTAVADSVAYTLAEDEESRRSWALAPHEWRRMILLPFLARVRAELAVAAEPDPRVADRIAWLLAGRVAEVRWGPDARVDFAVASDADIKAAIHFFPRLPELLQTARRMDLQSKNSANREP